MELLEILKMSNFDLFLHYCQSKNFYSFYFSFYFLQTVNFFSSFQFYLDLCFLFYYLYPDLLLMNFFLKIILYLKIKSLFCSLFGLNYFIISMEFLYIFNLTIFMNLTLQHYLFHYLSLIASINFSNFYFVKFLFDFVTNLSFHE